MKIIEVVDRAMSVNSGRVKLSADQHRRRAHCLKGVKGQDGVFEVVSPIRFKVGERFGYDSPDNAGPGKNVSEPAATEKAATEKAATKKAATKKAAT